MSSSTASQRNVGKEPVGLEAHVPSAPIPPAPSTLTGFATRSGIVRPARVGDHHAIQRLLVSTLQTSPAEFQAQLEDPQYDPAHRLVIGQQHQVLAHALLVPREMRFGDVTLPILLVKEMVVEPEFRGHGLGQQLLAAIDERLVETEAALAVLHTTQPTFFQQYGWHVCFRHSYSVANAREILSQLGEQSSRRRCGLLQDEVSLSVRIWRHVELSALIKLYEAGTRHSFGPLVRGDEFWQWLISRHGYDQIYLAIYGQDKVELDDIRPIVGYAVVQQGRILELVTDAAHTRAGDELLARACRDAIEHDLHHVRLDAPPNDPRHAVFAAAGGRQQYHEAENGDVSLIRVPDPMGLLRQLCGLWHERLKAAGLPVPVDLGVVIDGQKYALQFQKKRVKCIPGRLGRSYIECDRSLWLQLMLGHTDPGAALAGGRLQSSTRVAADVACALFAQRSIWRPAWDA